VTFGFQPTILNMRRLLITLLLAVTTIACDRNKKAAGPTTAPVRTSTVVNLDGQPLDPFASEPADRLATVFLFVTTDCPVSNAYAPEIKRLSDQYTKLKVPFYLVYADADLKPADLKKHYADYKHKCPAVRDPKHELVKLTGAGNTPEAAVVLPDGKVVYHGRIDNLYADYGKPRFAPTSHDLKDVLEAVIRKQKITPRTTEVIGCPIPS
jgi:hypothetical protein